MGLISPLTKPLIRPLTQSLAARSRGGVFNPIAEYATGTKGAWFTAYDNTYLQVNTDGTGGAVADGGMVGRWQDRSGSGNHLIKGTSTTGALYSAGKGVNSFYKITGGTLNSDMHNSSLAQTLHRGAISGGFVCWFPGSQYDGVIDYGPSSNMLFINGGGNTAGANSCEWMKYFNGASFINTNLRFSSRYCTVAFRNNSSGTMDVWVNGVKASLTALGAVNFTSLYMFRQSGGAAYPLRMFESLAFDRVFTDAEMSSLNNYLRQQAVGPAPSGVNAVFVYGDSLSLGIGSETGVPWHFDITNRPSHDWYCYALDGGTISVNPIITAARLATYKTSGESVAVIWIGTNDITSGAQTGAQLEATFNTYCTTLRNAGFKVVVCTLTDFTTNRAQKDAFNTALRANYTNYANAIADLAADSRLATNTDTIYFTSDQKHLLAAGYTVATSIIQTALASI